jgi:hypothetical protein
MKMARDGPAPLTWPPCRERFFAVSAEIAIDLRPGLLKSRCSSVPVRDRPEELFPPKGRSLIANNSEFLTYTVSGAEMKRFFVVWALCSRHTPCAVAQRTNGTRSVPATLHCQGGLIPPLASKALDRDDKSLGFAAFLESKKWSKCEFSIAKAI